MDVATCFIICMCVYNYKYVIIQPTQKGTASVRHYIVYYACVVVLPANINLRHVFPKGMKEEHKTLITPQMKLTLH